MYCLIPSPLQSSTPATSSSSSSEAAAAPGHLTKRHSEQLLLKVPSSSSTCPQSQTDPKTPELSNNSSPGLLHPGTISAASGDSSQPSPSVGSRSSVVVTFEEHVEEPVADVDMHIASSAENRLEAVDKIEEEASSSSASDEKQDESEH